MSGGYEFIRDLQPVREVLNGEPLPEKDSPKVWEVRRKYDGKIFRAVEIREQKKIASHMRTRLIALLDHPNLVSLVDVIVNNDNESSSDMSYCVWDNCRTSLNQLLVTQPALRKGGAPELLCWHVLEGVSQALLWLHCGRKDLPPHGLQGGVDPDWQPVLIVNLDPTRIFLCRPKVGETYGQIKVGGFSGATLTPSINIERQQFVETVDMSSPYLAPGVQQGEQWCGDISMAAEIWSLGAIIHRLMTGSPPKPNQASFPSDTKYSENLCELVEEMLEEDPNMRPATSTLANQVEAGVTFWRTLNIGREGPGDGGRFQTFLQSLPRGPRPKSRSNYFSRDITKVISQDTFRNG